MWLGSNLGKHKFFFWLLLRDKLNAINLLRRKNIHLDDYSCVFHNSGSEGTNMHLFFECPCIQACWISMSIIWNLTLQALNMILDARNLFGSTIFREVVIIVCWGSCGKLETTSFLTMQAPRWQDENQFQGGPSPGVHQAIKAKQKIKGLLSLWLENYSQCTLSLSLYLSL